MSISNNLTNLILDTKRHSFAHLMAAAVGKMFPEAQYGVGPVIENGCYYDFVLPRTLIPEDLVLLEGHLKEMLKAHLSFKVQELDIDEAIAHFDKANQPLKVELLMDLKTKGTTSMSEEEKADFSGISIQTKLVNLLKESEKTGKELYIDTIICNEKGQIFVQKRSADRKKFPNCWELVGGQVEEGETFEQAARREIKEELNFDLVEIIDYLKPFDYVLPFDMRKENENINHRIVPLIIKVKDYSSPVLEEGKAVEFAWVDENNIDLVSNGENNYTKDTVLKALALLNNSQNSQATTPTITLYRIVNESTGEILFEDLCKGPHIAHVKEIKNIGFKLDKFSAAYWRGDQARGINMQRLYALVYDTKEELTDYVNLREEAKKRDHRKLGQEMGIYMISEDVGAGLPLYLPNGATIRQLLERYCYQEAKKSGYQYVYTPHIGKSDLFAKSGHLDHYADGMFAPINMVNLKGEGVLKGQKVEQFYLKPMNCPMHHQIYLNKPRSYRELPYKLYEYGTVYRYEESGTLSGMIRVRGFTQNDAHVYCQRNQLKEVISEALNRFVKAYNDIGINEYKIRFSLPDFVNGKEKYGEETTEWIDAVKAMRQVLDELGVDYYDAIGEAAFYGPKIDIQVKNVNGKEDSLSTIQVDYSIAPKFGITYKNDKSEEEVPTIIHMALMGSVDRFMAFMIEMTGGKFPFWLAPEQIRILTLNDAVLPFVEKVKAELYEVVLMKPLKYNELRYTVDSRQETLGKKIRDAKLELIPMLIVIGPKDVEAGEVSVEYAGKSFKVKVGSLEEILEVVG